MHKMSWLRIKPATQYIFAQSGQNVPHEIKKPPAATFLPKMAKMRRLRIKNPQPVHFCQYILAILDKNVPDGGCLFSAGTFWPLWAKMYRTGVFDSQPEHFGHFGRKGTGWWFFIVIRYILAILGEKVAAGGVFLSGGTFWPFWLKIYWLGLFKSQLVHFGHLR